MKRYQQLRARYRTIGAILGLIFSFSSLLMLTPLLLLVFHPAQTQHATRFLEPALALATIGIVLRIITRKRQAVSLTLQEGGIIIVLSWGVVILFSSFPICTIENVSFTHGMFEAVSGWTTTGLSILDTANTSAIILLWRSIMQLVGGAGIAFIMLATIAGPAGTGLSTAEGRSQQLAPNAHQSAKLVVTIYSGYILCGILAFHLAGMSGFDAVNHTFAAVSTGGFSTQSASIGAWNSPTIECISCILMVLGSLNFVTAHLALKRKFRAVLRNGEVRAFITILLVAIPFFYAFSRLNPQSTASSRLRTACFEVLSAITSTGFTTLQKPLSGGAGMLLIIILMGIGGAACSTAGGIKLYRVHLLWQALKWELQRPLLPATTIPEHFIWQGEWKDYINDSRIRKVAVFSFLYIFSLLVGSAILTAHGYSIRNSIFEFASCLGTVGLSTGITSPLAPASVLWTEMAGMVLGRLEFIVIFVSLAKLMRDCRRLCTQ